MLERKRKVVEVVEPKDIAAREIHARPRGEIERAETVKIAQGMMMSTTQRLPTAFTTLVQKEKSVSNRCDTTSFWWGGFW